MAGVLDCEPLGESVHTSSGKIPGGSVIDDSEATPCMLNFKEKGEVMMGRDRRIWFRHGGTEEWREFRHPQVD